MPYLNGIDVSAHNGVFSTQGQDFVFMRACYGTAKDARFDQHYARAKAAGVVTGAYCFGRFQDPEDQADRLMDIAPDVDFLFLDRESDGANPTMTTAQARRFVQRVQSTGKRVGLYASESGYPKDAFGADYRWVANYSRKPSIPWSFWQYQGSPLDRNYFDGTLADLEALAGSGTAIPPGDASSSGEPPVATNLFPLTAHRVADIKAGTELLKGPGGDVYTTLSADITFGLIEATSTHYKVGDGDAGVWVKRDDVAAIRTADRNMGK